MPVGLWISERIWKLKTFGSKGETIIVLDDDRDGMLVAFGTWRRVERIGSVVMPRHIEIAWFGVHSDYHGVPYTVPPEEDPGEEGSAVVSDPFERTYSVAEVAYAEIERLAREHSDSTENMPITLTCHVDNVHALGFYSKVGFKLIPDPKLQVEGERGIYYRLVR